MLRAGVHKPRLILGFCHQTVRCQTLSFLRLQRSLVLLAPVPPRLLSATSLEPMSLPKYKVGAIGTNKVGSKWIQLRYTEAYFLLL